MAKNSRLGFKLGPKVKHSTKKAVRAGKAQKKGKT